MGAAMPGRPGTRKSGVMNAICSEVGVDEANGESQSTPSCHNGNEQLLTQLRSSVRNLVACRSAEICLISCPLVPRSLNSSTSPPSFCFPCIKRAEA